MPLSDPFNPRNPTRVRLKQPDKTPHQPLAILHYSAPRSVQQGFSVGKRLKNHYSFFHNKKILICIRLVFYIILIISISVLTTGKDFSEFSFFQTIITSFGAFVFSISLIALFCFHIDVFGLNFFFPRAIRLNKVSKKEPFEFVLISRSTLSGAFNTNRIVYFSGLRVKLTSKRLIVSWGLSFPGICIKEVKLSDIDFVSQYRNEKMFNKKNGVMVNFKPHNEDNFFVFYTRKPYLWLQYFKDAGVCVRG